jgi:RimJ/RimL family protein N-acetyltransferase
METFETERLILRPFTQADGESYFQVYWQIASDHNGDQRQADEHPNPDDICAENDNYLSFANYPFLRSFGRWMIVSKTEQRNIGVFHFIPHLFGPNVVALCADPQSHKLRFGAFEVIIGWALARPYRGYGYATEAARAMLAYGFEILKLQRIVSWADIDNAASINVMKKVGMQIISPPDSKEVYSFIENDQA